MESVTGESTPDLVVGHLINFQDEVLRALANAHEAKVDTIPDPSPASYLEASIYIPVFVYQLSHCGDWPIHAPTVTMKFD